ncbi:MFS transporter [Sarocladium strictum]
MSHFPPEKQDPEVQHELEEKRLLRKLDIRLLPLCAFIYLLCYLDRSNIGNARTLNLKTEDDIMHSIGMTQHEYLIALMVFLIAYCLFEAPSNILLKKLSPSRWIAFLMFSFGACTMIIGGSHNYAMLTAFRFLLGMFEAGLFPGLVYYTTFWYKREECSLRVAVFFASATLAGAFGGAIAFGVGHMNMTAGLEGWRWLFILEGMLSVIFSVVVLFVMPDYPDTASWLTPEEQILAAHRLGVDSGATPTSSSRIGWAEVRETLTTKRLYIHYLIFFLAGPPFSSLSLFTPSITAGLGFKDLEAQLMTVPPYASAYVCMIIAAIVADRYNARGIVTFVSGIIGAVGFIGSATLSPEAFNARYGCLIIASSGAFSCVSPLIGWLAGNTFSSGVTGLAIALNISLAAPGQITGVWIYKAEEAQIGFPTGHWTNAGCLLGLALSSLALQFYYRRQNKHLSTGPKFIL